MEPRTGPGSPGVALLVLSRGKDPPVPAGEGPVPPDPAGAAARAHSGTCPGAGLQDLGPVLGEPLTSLGSFSALQQRICSGS